MRIVRLVLSAALGTSALVGIQILATDYWLWSAAPTHAYGLMAFVALDLALILGVWRVTRLAMIGPLLTAAFQFVAMLGDIIRGEPVGLPAAVSGTTSWLTQPTLAYSSLKDSSWPLQSEHGHCPACTIIGPGH